MFLIWVDNGNNEKMNGNKWGDPATILMRLLYQNIDHEQ